MSIHSTLTAAGYIRAVCVCVFVRVYFLFGLGRQTNKSGDLINSNIQETREPFFFKIFSSTCILFRFFCFS